MPTKKLKPEQWTEYLQLFQHASDALKSKPWFADGWETRLNYLNQANPSGIWMQLVQKTWFDGNIHIETWLRNSTLEEGRLPVVLHVETSIPKHGLSRNDFTRVFLERAGPIAAGWEGYTVRPDYAMEPLSARVPFTTQTLVPVLVTEFERLHTLGDLINETIHAVKRA